MRLYLTGISGFVGSRLAEAWADHHELAGCSRQRPDWLEAEHHVLDLAEEPRHVADRLEAFRPDWVVHCAAVSQPALVGRDPAQARRVNVEAAHWVADWCRRRGRGLIAFSSDTVYPDAALTPAPATGWSERAELDPAHLYGRSKVEMEEAVRTLLPEALLLRCSLLWGRSRPGQNSFSGWLLAHWREGKPAPVFRDNRRHLLAAGALPAMIDGLRAVMEAGGGPRGALNLGGADYLSREDFALLFCRHLGLDEGLLRPLDTAEAGLAEAPARELPLDLGRLRRWLGEPPTTDEWLARDYGPPHPISTGGA
ncbi:MAG: sugar nucleotide-binding protein [bacterium]|jgi:dTDP-4-dehydrorhamnose reductase|nr:sugar nucleotide-binding protein [bacterium]